jgi:hypothetical protein
MFTLQTSFKPLLLRGGGGGESIENFEKQGGLFKTFVPMTSENSASGLVRDERRWGRRGCEDEEMIEDLIW